MNEHAAKQREYEAKRRAATNRPAPAVPLAQFRIMEKDGSERTERFETLVAAARAYPDAWRIERADRAGWW